MVEPKSNYRIWKYEVPMKERFTLDLPQGFRILGADVQRNDEDRIYMWVLHDITQPIIKCVPFVMVGTGNTITVDPMKLAHVATVQHRTFVWHIFLRGVAPNLATRIIEEEQG